jgi:two-component system nitrogen regulation response regulator NtrX
MRQLRELIGRAAASQRTVLIVGEAGAGKDVAARLVHDLSERTARPYLRVRCGGTSADQLEEELFGVAATPGKLGRAGLLETARGGSVALDECTALTSALRQRVARAIVDGAAPRVGGDAPVSLDVRYLLTTRDPEATGAGGTVSEALLSGVSVLPIVIPPLRERRSDIPLLVQHFRARLSREQGVPAGVSDALSMMSMLAEQWPGNVRELEHRVERDAYGAGEALPASTSPRSTGTFAVPGTARWTLEQLERRYIEHVLMQVEGNQSRAAVQLGIDRRTLYRKLKDYRSEGVELSQAG